MQVSISSITIPPCTPGICIQAFVGGGGEFVGAAPEGRAFVYKVTMFAIFEIFIIMARIEDWQHFGRLN